MVYIKLWKLLNYCMYDEIDYMYLFICIKMNMCFLVN